ncbi:MAG TPA: M23 family metallopeptidase [Myxococcota bacterium]|nr:M23 family metallopeptidase [Myxococcota bacterium]
MKNRRYAVVIMDSTGRHLRRITVLRRSLEIWGSVVALAVILLLAVTVHGIWVHADAQQALGLQHENAELGKIVRQLEADLPGARSQELLTEITFSQLWAKSGLGMEPRLLGMGPLETDSPEGADPDGTPPEVAELMGDDPLSLPLELERVQADGQALQTSLGETLEYFHDAERVLSNTPSIRPAKTPWLTSSFGVRRHPIFKYFIMHKGLDMGGHIGLPIRAPADGVIIWVGRRGGYGQTVVIDHGYGLQTHFAHLSKYLVRVGDRVHRGDPIAEMGNTGSSTGPHLHYEVRRAGQPLDPRRFILD